MRHDRDRDSDDDHPDDALLGERRVGSRGDVEVLRPTLGEAPRLAWTAARAWAGGRPVRAAVTWPGYCLTMATAIARRRLFRLRRPEGTALIVIGPLSRLERTGRAVLAALALLIAVAATAVIRAGLVHVPTLVVLAVAFGPGLLDADPHRLALRPHVAGHPEPARRRAVSTRRSRRSPPGAGAGLGRRRRRQLASPQRQPHRPARPAHPPPGPGDHVLHARTPALARVYRRWRWVPSPVDPRTMIRPAATPGQPGHPPG